VTHVKTDMNVMQISAECNQNKSLGKLKCICR
jgi:hypothetical protein